MSRLCLLLLIASACVAQIPAGIPRNLARERARLISDVRYRLHFTLTPHATSTSGHEVLTFQLKTVAPVLLDFREGTASALKVNGTPVPVKTEGGHIELPDTALRAGENTVEMDFTAPVGPAGKAITSYQTRSGANWWRRSSACRTSR